MRNFYIYKDYSVLSPLVTKREIERLIEKMVSLTSLLNLYCEQAKWRELTLLYQQIRRQGFQPNSFTFSTLLKFSSSSSSLDYEGQSIHADATKHGFVSSDNYVINSLITMYVQCGSLSSALKVFDEMLLPQTVNFNTIISSCFQAGDCTKARTIFERMREFHTPNEVTWSAMISGYAQNSQFEDALSFFKKMIRESCVYPNSHTITGVLSACGQIRDIGFGEQVHGYTIKMSNYVENDVFVGTSLIDLYGKCGYQELAELVFDLSVDKCVVSWSVLIATYVRNSCPSRGVQAFREMVYSGLEPNVVTLSTLTSACSDIPNLILGKELHGFIVRRKAVRLDVFVSTSLIDMYSKCHCMLYAHRIFEKDCKNLSGLVTTTMWNAMIAGFVENNCLDDAWKLFRSMNQGNAASLKPNTVTMAIILPLCTKVSSLLYGKEVHCYAVKNGLDDEMLVGNNLLDMYAKCGKLHMAENQFNKMLRRNRISWTSMINGYAVHGDGEGAIRFFQRMVTETDIKPDHVAFVALISACSHAGMVEDGLRYFESMSKDYSLIPKQENYGAVVDLLARAGHIDEAKKLISMMPMKPGANVWGALLGACRIHGNVKEAENAAENLLKLEPKEGGFRKLLSSLYSEMGRLDSVAEVRSAMREMNVIKRQGFSWLETNEGIHGFVAGR